MARVLLLLGDSSQTYPMLPEERVEELVNVVGEPRQASLPVNAATGFGKMVTVSVLLLVQPLEVVSKVIVWVPAPGNEYAGVVTMEVSPLPKSQW